MVLSWVAIALVCAGYLHAQEPSDATGVPPSPHRALLNRYCVTCHNERLKTAGLLLDKTDVEKVSTDAEVWEKVVRKLRAGQMPPAGVPRPEKATYDAFAAYLETELDRAAAAKPNPGRRGAFHRLNRVEYANAIRDLVAVEIDGAALLPADDSGRGFDNLADLLVVSPLLMERYMSAAGRISSLAIGDSGIGPATETYTVPLRFMQEDRASEDLPFGTRGGFAVRHRFPLDGEYSIKVRLARSGDGYIRGIRGDPHQLDVRLDGAQVKRFTIGGVNIGPSGPLYPRNGTFYRGDPRQIEYEFNADENFEVRFPAKAGTRLVGVAFLKHSSEPEGMLLPRPMYPDIIDFKGGDPAVDSITITGPYSAKGAGETPSRQRIFVCAPAGSADEEPCARKILSALARRAYRRPVTNEDVEPLLSLYKTGRSEGSFDAGIGAALQAILVSPEFLFRIERDAANVPPETAYRISDLEMASRLSFFLWSSIPDDELLDLAEQGRLKEPAVLERQVRRMVADSRSKALVENFAGQWLFLRNMRQVSPDPRNFPDFDEELRQAFQQETQLLFESMLREDRSALDLLKADYTFVNERLARHYGIPNVYGSRFRRVAVTDEARKGLLGQGSILTVTSHANKTSPVRRGKWVLEQLLGTPPPPPPPDVPALEEKNKEGKPLTIRQQMEQHRGNPACAGCHKLMDPIGFALENFDPVGRWRTAELNAPIDASGVLYDGTKFQGAVEFRQVLLSHSEQYIRTLTEKLLTYALGREVQYYDAPAVRKITREAAASEYRWSSLILGIVKSAPFQMRRSRES
jgi:mono/diheme cytochrome c family protein